MFVRLHNPAIVCLLEPKVSGDQANSICSSFGFEEWIRVEAVGFSGGIWIMWKNTIIIEEVETHPQFITIQVANDTEGPWVLSVVYGSPNQGLRRRLFAELSQHNTRGQDPWLVAGDFNSVVSQDKVSNPESFSLNRCVEFNDWIFREGLMDLGFTGPKFTWARGQHTSTFKGARLDRVLGNVEWKIKFSEAVVEHLPRIESDHTPHLVNTKPVSTRTNSRGFRYNLAWATHPTFQLVIQPNWDNNKEVEINKERLVVALDSWNKTIFGNRSREEWINSGYRNTKYYHVATAIRNSPTKITSLRDDQGFWITDEHQLKGHVRQYFKELFSKDSNTISLEPMLGNFPVLTQENWNEVNRPYTKEEIKAAMFEMSPSKALGPDGFSAGFYQTSWEIVGDSLTQFALKFFADGQMPKGCNDTLISLIPKVSNPKTVTQLRPIGLCNVTYKLLTKAMTNRLKEMSKKLIGSH
ncbi:uncharacterized protein LOC115999360 [Ipomoea triloba]|uniref:uncharacterized protein LOC115999360 n=1 Tax=Ipomoea triloba TaxID=35885 RepID=UPI00125D4F33|nr:uncharacterized protein LOC115999360 [Ipomoea triloba]